MDRESPHDVHQMYDDYWTSMAQPLKLVQIGERAPWSGEDQWEKPEKKEVLHGPAPVEEP
ncbi:hypothetical protein [Mumia zhuanghuii]|uniref:Uncharacterized protein n=1 Tax=Mumia zhuanghuii TaxID=2585211 RepID=A0A5C4MFS3_9ACTN|nr:hypothetical protein [Mumia zhuanghuii]TNC35587.1 hypothetical protein FHE65_26940 [Mumia zhuanghuii]